MNIKFVTVTQKKINVSYLSGNEEVKGEHLYPFY